MNTRLEVQRTRRRHRGGCWIIVGLPGPDIRWCGPYDTREDADADRRGLERFYRQEEKPRCNEQ